MQTISSKQKIDKLEKDIKAKTDQFDKLQDDFFKLEKANKKFADESTKMKARIQKLINRKGKFDSGLKTCKNCGKDYNEKENFNWSCTQHIGDWSGQMWWCCGKLNKEDRGCKFGKHESKDDEDEDLRDDSATAKLKA